MRFKCLLSKFFSLFFSWAGHLADYDCELSSFSFLDFVGFWTLEFWRLNPVAFTNCLVPFYEVKPSEGLNSEDRIHFSQRIFDCPRRLWPSKFNDGINIFHGRHLVGKSMAPLLHSWVFNCLSEKRMGGVIHNIEIHNNKISEEEKREARRRKLIMNSSRVLGEQDFKIANSYRSVLPFIAIMSQSIDLILR